MPDSKPWDGYPSDREVRQWHWLRRKSCAPMPALWEPGGAEMEPAWEGHAGEIGCMPPDRAADQWTYLGPVLTPTDLAVAVEAARREEIERCAARLKVLANEARIRDAGVRGIPASLPFFHPSNTLDAAAAVLRALQPAPTDALATRLAEAEARGAARERDRCAQLAFDQQSDDPQPCDGNAMCREIAAAIRSGGAA